MAGSLGVLSTYTLIEELGRGSFARVYRAHDSRLDRDVALKVLYGNTAEDDTFHALFEQEAQAAARLRHPNIVVIYEMAEAEGRLFIAMELLPGRNLERRIMDEGPFDLDRLVSIVAQVGSALDLAHSVGIVHRDVKSANIIVDDKGHATLTDFGLVRAISGSVRMSSRYGTFGMVGTAAYMAPEQTELTGVVDARTDIYSLGVVAYEMLAGRLPFVGNDPLSVALAQRVNTPPRPGQFGRSLPAQVEDVILRSLAKEPGERYQTADELARGLWGAVGQARREAEAEALRVQQAAERERREAEREAEEERRRKEADARALLEARQRAEAERLQAERRAEEGRLLAAKRAEEERRRQEAEERARLEAERRAEEERLRKDAEERARLAAERTAELERLHKEAEERAQREAALRAAEERRRKEAEERAQQEADKRAEAERLEAQQRLETERLQAERRAEEGRRRKEAEERAKLEAKQRTEDERQRKEAERRAREEAQSKEQEGRRQEDAERARAVAARRAEEERQRKEAEERARKERAAKREAAIASASGGAAGSGWRRWWPAGPALLVAAFAIYFLAGRSTTPGVTSSLATSTPQPITSPSPVVTRTPAVATPTVSATAAVSTPAPTGCQKADAVWAEVDGLWQSRDWAGVTGKLDAIGRLCLDDPRLADKQYVARYNLGSALLAGGKYADAKTACQSALDVNPQGSEAKKCVEDASRTTATSTPRPSPSRSPAENRL